MLASLYLTDHAAHDADILAKVRQAYVVKWAASSLRASMPIRICTFPLHALGQTCRPQPFAACVSWRRRIGFVARDITRNEFNPVARHLRSSSWFCLSLSIFEIGYFENDKLGAEREQNPVLTDARLDHLKVMDQRVAWLWSIILAAIGITLLTHSDVSSDSAQSPSWIWLAAPWLALLIVSRATFAVFNRIDEVSRIFVYWPLQLMKGLGIVIALQLPMTAAGLALLIAQPLSRWIPYIVYRFGGQRWQTPDRIIRFYIHSYAYRNTRFMVKILLSCWNGVRRWSSYG